MSSHVDPRRTMGFALKRLQQALRARMDEALAPHGLTAPQYAVLALLAEDPGISNAELARRSFVAAPTMIRIVTALAREGLITRSDPPDTGRIRGTTLTGRGRTRLAAARKAVQDLEDVLVSQAAPGDVETVLRWLQACADDLLLHQATPAAPDRASPAPPTPGPVATRIARPEDATALTAIDDLTWTTSTTPAPRPDPPRPFFVKGRREPADVVVAEVGGAVVGYAGLSASALPSHAHVREIGGLAVHPAAAGRGVGRALVEAAVAEAGRRGARKVTLRVLGSNKRARRLYARCGFAEEGVLRDEFVLDGHPVDDVLMARWIA